MPKLTHYSETIFVNKNLNKVRLGSPLFFLIFFAVLVFYSIYDTEVFVLFFARLVCELTDCDLKISLKDT